MSGRTEFPPRSHLPVKGSRSSQLWCATRYDKVSDLDLGDNLGEVGNTWIPSYSSSKSDEGDISIFGSKI